MIVASRFPGDDWTDLQWGQHDVYKRALDLMVGACWRGMEATAPLAGRKASPTFRRLNEGLGGFDHRTLQGAHDHLAAWWRWSEGHHSTPQSAYPSVVELTFAWMDWLAAETDGWVRDGAPIVVLIFNVLSEQNSSLGYRAEEALLTALRRRYPLPT